MPNPTTTEAVEPSSRGAALRARLTLTLSY